MAEDKLDPGVPPADGVGVRSPPSGSKASTPNSEDMAGSVVGVTLPLVLFGRVVAGLLLGLFNVGLEDDPARDANEAPRRALRVDVTRQGDSLTRLRGLRGGPRRGL